MSEARRAGERIIECPKCGAKNRLAPESQTSGEPVCGRCKTPLAGAVQPIIITDRNFAQEVQGSALPVLIDFWAPWCGPCRIVGPVVDQLAKELSGRARIGKLNVDQNQVTASRFHVQSIPTLLIFKNGQEVDRLVGAYPKEVIRQRLERHL